MVVSQFKPFSRVLANCVSPTQEISEINNKYKKNKGIPVTGSGSPYSCEMLRVPHFLDNRLTDGGKVSLMRRPPFTTQENSWYSFLLEAESTPRGVVGLEKLGQPKKSNELVGNRTRDLSVCSIVKEIKKKRKIKMTIQEELYNVTATSPRETVFL
jgi:hypothetical protein